MTFLIDTAPPILCLVILTRADPPLLLSRLCARGQLAEICAGHLRFTFEETDAFLQQMLGLALAPEEVVVFLMQGCELPFSEPRVMC